MILDLDVSVIKELENDSLEKGVYLSIDEKGFNRYIYFRSVVDILESTQADVAIELSMFKRLPNPYSNCDLDQDDSQSEFYNYRYLKLLKSANYSYSLSLCNEICKHEKRKTSCGCQSINNSLRMNSSFKFCQTANVLKAFSFFYIDNRFYYYSFLFFLCIWITRH